jgi:hypothetical protein
MDQLMGGVLLTDGWGHRSRKLAAKAFALSPEEMENRHHLTFDTYEEEKLTLEEYLSWVISGHLTKYTSWPDPFSQGAVLP